MTHPRATLRLSVIPDRNALPERLATNPLIPRGTFDAARATHPSPYPSRKAGHSKVAIDAETVIYRLEEAGQTLLSLPHRGPSTALRQTRHQYLAEAIDAFGAESDTPPQIPTPSAARITRMDQALAWVPLIPEANLVLRRIVGCRSLVSPLTERHLFTWRRLARLLGADHKAIQRWHATGVDIIVATLNRDATLAAAWDTLG
jgi:hypothetical protein